MPLAFNRIKITAALAALSLSLALPVTAFAWVGDEDQSEPTDSEIAAALSDGSIDLDASEDDGVELLAARSYAITSIGGATRYDTSAKEALASFSSASTVVISGGEVYADSIAGSGLAGALDAPILLTDPSSLPEVISNAIRTLGASKVIVLGGEQAVSSHVAQQLGEIVGSGNVTRLSGPTRFETQMALYTYGVQNGLWSGDTAVVATGDGFADALSISPVSFKLKAPVFFTTDGALPEAQAQAIVASGCKRFLIAGGTTVVSSSVEKTLSSYGQVVRLGGATRYDTSLSINRYAVSSLGFSWDGVAFSSGQKPWDSLGGGSMQGKKGKLLSLLDNNGPMTEPSIYVDGKPASVVFLGGKDVYPNSYKAQFAYKKGYSLTDIQGFKVYIDAGHGYDSSDNGLWDSGAIGCDQQEAKLTEELADKVAGEIGARYGIECYVNKTGYYRYRQVQASALDCGLFLSIHFNADESGTSSGSETYTHIYHAQWGSTHLQNCLTDRLANAVGRGNRGAKQAELAVVGGKVPATLCEICFITNWGDVNTYLSRKDIVARALAEGVGSF